MLVDNYRHFIVQAKRGDRSVESKKLRKKAYRQKKKKVRQVKYYEKLSEDSLKKRYRSIPVEEKLPIGIVESDHDKTEELSSSEKEQVSDNQHSYKLNEPVEDVYITEGSIPPIFAPIVIPVDETLPSPLPTQSQHSDVIHVLQYKEVLNCSIPPIFAPIVIPVDETLPSPLPTQSQHIVMSYMSCSIKKY